VRNGAVRLALPLSQVHVPQSVQAVLAARIDRLTPEDKEVLQTVAVIGREFSVDVVCRVAARAEEEIERALNQLQLADFIYEQPAVSGPEFIFKHALTQEVAYNSQLTDRRKLTHERIGEAIEALYADSLEDHLTELAYHFSRSANAHKAVDYLRRAGQQAMQRSAYSSAMTYLSAGLELLPALPAGLSGTAGSSHCKWRSVPPIPSQTPTGRRGLPVRMSVHWSFARETQASLNYSTC